MENKLVEQIHSSSTWQKLQFNNAQANYVHRNY